MLCSVVCAPACSLGMGSIRAKGRRILIVDDQKINRLVLGKLLSKLGYEVMYGTTGIEAVECFSQSMAACDERDGLFCILMVRFHPCGPTLSLDLYLMQCLVRASSAANLAGTAACRSG